MEYKFRRLEAKDVFPMSRIITKIGFKEFKEAFADENVQKNISSKKSANAIGMAVMLNIAGIVIGNLSKCETDLYEFFASVTDLSAGEIKEAPLVDFTNMIVDLVKHDDFKDFLKVVSKLLK